MIKNLNLASWIVYLLSITFLSGCAHQNLRTDFKGYAGSYGDMVNYQMLLNMARADNGHPTHFLAIGEIVSDHSIQTQVGGAINQTDSLALARGRGASSESSNTINRGPLGEITSSVGRFISGTTRTAGNTLLDSTIVSGTSGVTSSTTPKYKFIPMNNEEVAQQLLEPIDTGVFETLFDQGWPVDQLMRVLIERIEMFDQNTGRGEVFVNSPSRASTESYAKFLRACQIARNAQQGGWLILQSGSKSSDIVDGELTGLTPEQLVETGKSNLGWVWTETANGKWKVKKSSSTTNFVFINDKAPSIRNLTGDDDRIEAGAVAEFISLVGKKLEISGGVRGEENRGAQARLVMRSYSRVLEAVGIEQNAFCEFMGSKGATEITPCEQRQPILQTRNLPGKTHSALVSVNYEGNQYSITDPIYRSNGEKISSRDRLATWNRDSFRLVTQLASQVAVDISKFRRQVLELE